MGKYRPAFVPVFAPVLCRGIPPETLGAAYGGVANNDPPAA